MEGQYIITEWLLETKYSDLNMHIYKLNNFEFKDSFYFNSVAKKKIGLFSIRDTYIGLWKPLEDFEYIKFYINNKNISINEFDEKRIDNIELIKKRLMELLITETIKETQKHGNNCIWKIIKNNYFMSYFYEENFIKYF